MKTLTYKGTEYKFPFSEKFRRHTKSELAMMAESIEANGIKHPVLVYEDEQHGKNCVLDGEGRLTSAAGIKNAKVPFKKLGKMETADAYEEAKIYNDHRRQDDAESIAKRKEERIERVAKARGEGQSIRQIAEAEGVSAAQAHADVQEATVQGLTVEPETVKGKDGKERKASTKVRCARCERLNLNNKDCEKCKEARAAKKADKKPPPEDKPEELDTIKEIESICRCIDQLNVRLEAIKMSPLSYSLHFPTIVGKLKEARETMWQGRAICDCPYCKGKGESKGEKCKTCRGTCKVIKRVEVSGLRAVGGAA